MTSTLPAAEDAWWVRAVVGFEEPPAAPRDGWRLFVDTVNVAPERLAAAMERRGWPPVDAEAAAQRVGNACWEHALARPAARVGALHQVLQLTAAAGPGLLDGDVGLVVDVSLQGPLPLRALLEDIARLRGSMVVAAIPLGDDVGANGRCAWDGRSIYVRPDLPAGRLLEVVAHETAHTLDPGLATVDSVGLEDFAEQLGPLLVDHQPATVAAAAQLISDVLDRLEPRRIRPPVGSPAALIRWAVLDITGPATNQRRRRAA